MTVVSCQCPVGGANDGREALQRFDRMAEGDGFGCARLRGHEGISPEERFGLTTQLRRAAVSVPLNIAEGQGRHATRDFLRCLSFAYGSLQEVETQLIIARRLEYLEESLQAGLFDLTNEVARLINGLMNSLSSRDSLNDPVPTDY